MWMPPLGRGFLGFLVGFPALGWATQLSPVQSVDRVVRQHVSQRQGSGVALALNALTRLADPPPLLLGAVLVAVMLRVASVLRCWAFVTCAMVAAFASRLCCKLWFPRFARVSSLGQPLSSYPSGLLCGRWSLPGCCSASGDQRGITVGHEYGSGVPSPDGPWLSAPPSSSCGAYAERGGRGPAARGGLGRASV